MKKKLLALVCMLTCIFSLTACGEAETYTEYEQQKLEVAQEVAANNVITLFTDYLCQGYPFDVEGLTMEEISYLCNQYFQVEADGYAVKTGVASFSSALDTMGEIVGIMDTSATIDGNQIVVNVEVAGAKKDATAEIVLSNDMFMKLESASLNPTASMGELMKRAGLNTLIGMGTVFAVLILISLIISAFAIIPKIQAAAKKRKDAKEAANKIEETQPEVVETVDATDDLELVAVIAAAIAASEGAASTDGFVVRSIRRRY